MLVFIPGLPQCIAMIPNLDDQSAQPQWTMIKIGECDIVGLKVLCLVLFLTGGAFDSVLDQIIPVNQSADWKYDLV
jgi:hypothetical protein